MAKKKKGRARKSSGISENDSEEPERADLVEDTRTEEVGEGEETVSAAAASEEDMEEEQEQEVGEEETREEPDRILQCRESPEGFLAALSDHHNKDLEFDLEESLASLSSEDLASLWLSLHDHLRSVGEDARLEVVSGLVTVTKLTLSLPTLQEENCPQGLISSAGLLHDILPSLADPKLCNSLAQSLETYFTINLPDKDSVILNVLIFLLRKSLGEKAAKNDVRRVWSLHTTLLQQTLTETETLTRLVAATAGSNLFLSTSEGVKWLTFLHSLSPALVLRLHQESRASLPRLSKAGCRGLGEVYHKAWLVSGGEFRARLETDCLQDLMYRGMVGRKQEAKHPHCPQLPPQRQAVPAHAEHALQAVQPHPLEVPQGRQSRGQTERHGVVPGGLPTGGLGADPGGERLQLGETAQLHHHLVEGRRPLCQGGGHHRCLQDIFLLLAAHIE